MNKIVVLFMAFALTLNTLPLYAQIETDVKVLKLGVEVPEALNYLPEPPAFGTEKFILDSILYERGRETRDTERGELAVADADISLDYFLARFGEVMEVELTAQKYPVVASYVKTTYKYARKGIQTAKDAFSRVRPYQHFNTPSAVPQEEEPDDFTSYPSGHSVRGWVIAMALSAIDPDHAEEILHVGYELGQSRVIVGYHYQSDVDAARMCASACFASLCSSRQYIRLMRKARRELWRK